MRTIWRRKQTAQQSLRNMEGICFEQLERLTKHSMPSIRISILMFFSIISLEFLFKQTSK
ncbi:CLUMA_CG010873, isoform A [Clunio marinus]|uniref:CLUMA_CG010873, isoform A n=1 Tax=Clunio marinus TaxID=568069 RepID=A0A1J1ID55_9DIPT|nr:CLUMA_CG010873, isoform A [Clunio marinus]